MPRPGLRSHAQARKKFRTPGNKNVNHYKRRKPKISHCAICKRPLYSIPRARPSKMRNTAKSKRKANRLESGRYCASCLKNLISEKVKSQ
ncbi:MAG: 50S ribosomal protein L34e [Candidatus Hermodarchaeota archaeon]